jgi:hypothetical protein
MAGFDEEKYAEYEEVYGVSDRQCDYVGMKVETLYYQTYGGGPSGGYCIGINPCNKNEKLVWSYHADSNGSKATLMYNVDVDIIVRKEDGIQMIKVKHHITPRFTELDETIKEQINSLICTIASHSNTLESRDFVHMLKIFRGSLEDVCRSEMQ